HFLNFMAFPITLGVGLDYAVNYLARVPERGPVEALRESGGAIILCSMTTTFGYLALLGSINQGVRSLGLAAALGEVCVLLAAVALLPAVLGSGRMRRGGSRSEGSSSTGAPPRCPAPPPPAPPP